MEGLTDLLLVESMRLDLLIHLILAALLGGMIGLERELSGKAAGFRTNLLICVGAALLTDLSIEVARDAGPGVPADPARIAAQIVSGIGFLGAGTIIQARGSVVGLTTAATLWVVAAIGMAVGAGRLMEAVGGALLVIVALILLRWVEERLIRFREGRILITLDEDLELIKRIQAEVEEAKLDFSALDVERADGHLSIMMTVRGRAHLWKGLTARLMAVEGVRRVSHP